MHEISYMFQHSLGAIISGSSLQLRQCFQSGLMYAAQSHTCIGIKIQVKHK